MKTKVQEKILKSLINNRLNPTSGQKKWYNYILEIQHLTTFRNNLDGFIIDVSDFNNNYLERVMIQVKPVFEYGCVYNKCFLFN